jgi:hypothetical protein
LEADAFESLVMTVIFIPPGAGVPTTVEVPLIAIPWGWHGNASFQAGRWAGYGEVMPHSVIVDPDYPIWNSFWTNHQFDPPLPEP